MAVAMMILNDAKVDPRQMSIAGYAEYHPAATNDTPEGRRANRRVDIVVVAPTGTMSPVDPDVVTDALTKAGVTPAP